MKKIRMMMAAALGYIGFMQHHQVGGKSQRHPLSSKVIVAAYVTSWSNIDARTRST